MPEVARSFVDPLGVAGVAPTNDLVDEAKVDGSIIEVDSAAQLQRIRAPIAISM
ncbi:hypothetical protein ACVWZK_008483 [Bradyrhizobium sp. GM0.4]